MKQNKIFVFIVLLLFFVTSVYGETVISKQPDKPSLLFFWTITKTESDDVEQYSTFFKHLEDNNTIKVCINISPMVVDKWLNHNPDLIETMKRLKRNKRIEIIVSPWHDIILPMVYDLDSVRQLLPPNTEWPKEKFAYPEDISEQISRSWELSNRVFGDISPGLVPPMGTISSEVIDYLVNRCKFNISWIVVPDNILTNIDYLPALAYKTKIPGPLKKICFFLRETKWSKLLETPDILVSPDDTTKKFVDAIRQAGNQERLPLTVILITGETFWSHSGPQGKLLIEKLFDRLNTEKEIATILPDEYFLVKPFFPEITKFAPVTWSENGFAAWVGEQQENVAWELLAKSRKSLEEYKNSGQAEVKKFDVAFEEIYSVEDGDNFYYFGADYDTESREKEEKLERDFRNRLITVYKQIDLSPPSELFHPLEGLTFLGSLTRNTDSDNQLVNTIITRIEKGFIISDALGDDYGPGDYVYPQANLSPGAFDIQKFSCSLTEQEICLIFSLTPSEKVSGLGLAIIDIYIDLNNRIGAGMNQLLTGRGAYTTPESAWEFCLTVKGKNAILYQAVAGGQIRELGTYPVYAGTGTREYNVYIPRTVLRGSPQNWGYLVIVCGVNPNDPQGKIMEVKELPDAQNFGGALAGKIAPPIIDLIPPPGVSQKTLLNTYKSGRVVQLPTVRLPQIP